MTQKEKWDKHTELAAKAALRYAEWRAVCKEINALLMIRTSDQPKRVKRSRNEY